MTVLKSSGALGLLVPAHYRRAHVMAAVSRGYRVAWVRTESPRRRSATSTFRQILQIGCDVLFAVWGAMALAFWLLIIVGFV
jgi:hypothetical protein